MRVRRLLAADVSLIAAIGRSERVDVQYRVIEGRLLEQAVDPSFESRLAWLTFLYVSRRTGTPRTRDLGIMFWGTLAARYRRRVPGLAVTFGDAAAALGNGDVLVH